MSVVTAREGVVAESLAGAAHFLPTRFYKPTLANPWLREDNHHTWDNDRLRSIVWEVVTYVWKVNTTL